MSKITISDPSEGTTYSGYYSIEVIEHGDVVAEAHIAPSQLPSVDGPEELAELGEVIQQTALQLEEIEGV
jgi:hypothetical protein